MSKRTRAEALQTKKNILEAAQKIFAAKGFAKASLSDIAREANVTRGAIYWHFENKSELLAALCEDEACRINLYTTLRQAVEENQRDPLGLIKKWALLHLTEDAEALFNSSLASTVESVMSSDVRSDVKEKIVDMLRARMQVLESALRAAVAQKQLPADLDIELAAVYLDATVNGLINLFRLGLTKHPLSYYKNVIDVAFINLSQIRRQRFMGY